MRRRLKMLLLFAVTAVISDAAALRSGEARPKLAEPQYNEKGELKLPGDYRDWVFEGSNIGLEYRKDVRETTEQDKKPRPEKGIGDFHNVYINAEAYEQYLRTGKFSEKTMLAMDV